MSVNKIAKIKSRILGELECEIMKVLWQSGAGNVRDVLNSLPKRNNSAYTTVMTVMNRLAEKGVLCREATKDGCYLYKPKDSKEAFYGKVSKFLFQEVLRNAGSAAVAQFIDAMEEVDPKLLKDLRQRLNK